MIKYFRTVSSTTRATIAFLVVICQQVMFADMAPTYSSAISTCCTKMDKLVSLSQSTICLPWLTGVFLFLTILELVSL